MRLPTALSTRLQRTRSWLVASLLFVALAACRSPGGGIPEFLHAVPVEKPWTKETIEKHDDLYLELSSGKVGVIVGPVLSSDEHGEFLTTKTDSSVHFPLADVVVMDVFDREAYVAAGRAAESSGTAKTEAGETPETGGESAGAGPDAPTAISVVAGSFFALWGAVLYFLPAVAVYLIFF